VSRHGPPDDERRPGGGGAGVDWLDDNRSVTLTALARHLLARVPAGVVTPRYGSSEWDELPDQDPRRAASIVIAAEAWRDHCSPSRVAEDMRRQLAEEDTAAWRRIREASWDVSAARDWRALSQQATFAELQQRRAS
jgi:hypothetical protein